MSEILIIVLMVLALGVIGVIGQQKEQTPFSKLMLWFAVIILVLIGPTALSR